MYSWALAHAAWLHSRFRVSSVQTAFECATGRCYSGRIAQFGERVFGFIRQERKGDPKWLPAIWLGKAFSNDVHLLAHEGVIFRFKIHSKSKRQFSTRYAWQHPGWTMGSWYGFVRPQVVSNQKICRA